MNNFPVFCMIIFCMFVCVLLVCSLNMRIIVENDLLQNYSRFMLSFRFMSKNVLAEISLVVIFFCHIYTNLVPFSFSFQFVFNLVLTLCSLMVDNRVSMCTETFVSIRKPCNKPILQFNLHFFHLLISN